MKFTVLALGAAVAGISCVSPCSAQLNIESFRGAQPAGRLAFQGSEAGEDVFSQAPTPAPPVVDSDYFAEGAPGEGLGDPQSIRAEQPSTLTSAPQTAPQGQAPAQAPYRVLAGTPEIGMVPVCWPEGMRGCQTPNPIADFMMRNWCTDGLWDTYAADRARQCARIQHHTGGYNRYSHGCSHGCASGCSTCDSAPAWSVPVAAGYANAASTAPVAGLAQAPSKPIAQLVVSPAMSAPTQLPAAQATPALAPTEYSLTPVPPASAETEPAPPQEDRATPSPLPAQPLPANVPVVASRSAALRR